MLNYTKNRYLFLSSISIEMIFKKTRIKNMKRITLILLLLSTFIFANTNLKIMVNQKHTKPINLMAKTDKYVITYSKEEAILKVWDKKSDRLVKEFTNVNSLLEVTVLKNTLFLFFKNKFKI